MAKGAGMGTSDERGSAAGGTEGVTDVDLKFEAVVIPVADTDRAKGFYGRLGWRLDADFGFDNGFRVVQFTPPGSGCSVQFGWYAAYMIAAQAGTGLPT
jgi:catechol 2,3-dioxygenase-like lactoylglutathione lyase family enzyme